MVISGEISTPYVMSADQIEDVVTKALSKSEFKFVFHDGDSKYICPSLRRSVKIFLSV